MWVSNSSVSAGASCASAEFKHSASGRSSSVYRSSGTHVTNGGGPVSARTSVADELATKLQGARKHAIAPGIDPFEVLELKVPSTADWGDVSSPWLGVTADRQKLKPMTPSQAPQNGVSLGHTVAEVLLAAGATELAGPQRALVCALSSHLAALGHLLDSCGADANNKTLSPSAEQVQRPQPLPYATPRANVSPKPVPGMAEHRPPPSPFTPGNSPRLSLHEGMFSPPTPIMPVTTRMALGQVKTVNGEVSRTTSQPSVNRVSQASESIPTSIGMRRKMAKTKDVLPPIFNPGLGSVSVSTDSYGGVLGQAVSQMHKRHLSRLEKLDMLVVTVILANAAIVGISSDISWTGWDHVEYSFTGFFLGELLLKTCVLGAKEYFTGHLWKWNLFDTLIVGFAVVDLIVSLAWQSGDLQKLTIIRMARLCRVVRMLRLLRFKFFAELKMMVHGVFAGLRVLLWAMVLFLSFLYFLAIVTRNVLVTEDQQDSIIVSSFGKVPWAMVTLFRCLTDSCTAEDGTPLQVHLLQRYGFAFMVTYMLTVLFVTIGLFNLIMAIFVDNVMESKRVQRNEERAADMVKVERRLRRAVMKCLADQVYGANRSNLTLTSKMVNQIKNYWSALRAGRNGMASDTLQAQASYDSEGVPPITREMFCNLLLDPTIEELLSDLHIETSNRMALFDCLDADMSGELDLDEVICGLLSLRGPAEKKDAVGAMLCTRATQVRVKALYEELTAAHARLEKELTAAHARLEKEQHQLRHDLRHHGWSASVDHRHSGA